MLTGDRLHILHILTKLFFKFPRGRGPGSSAVFQKSMDWLAELDLGFSVKLLIE